MGVFSYWNSILIAPEHRLNNGSLYQGTERLQTSALREFSALLKTNQVIKQ